MLETANVSKDFEGLRAVDDVSLSVSRGEIVGLIGPNGSGKSTLLNVISGVLPPSSGRIAFNGHDITHYPPDRIFKLGLGRGFQDPSLFFQMTVLDNTLLPTKHQTGEHPWYAPWRRFWKDEERQNTVKAGGILDSINLRDLFGQRASNLSGGQMKLLDIARSLMGAPIMLLLDEPTAGVAPNLAYDIFRQIEIMRRELGITFLVIEHRLEILFNFVDRVYVMHNGRILAAGTPGDISADTQVREVYFGE